ncbi:MAG: hypothetical protein NVS3B7_14020 [Candidatus Elarobacter sp.]
MLTRLVRYDSVPKGRGVEDTVEWSLIRSDAREAGAARVGVRRFLSEHAEPDSDLEGAETIVGELVANVILHAPGPIGVYVSWTGESAVLIVSDRGGGLPTVRPCPDGAAESGRGLLLVQALANAVEFYTIPHQGSRIVVELPVRRRPTPPAPQGG